MTICLAKLILCDSLSPVRTSSISPEQTGESFPRSDNKLPGNLFALWLLKNLIDFSFVLKAKILACVLRWFIQRMNVYMRAGFTEELCSGLNSTSLDFQADFPLTNIACLSLILRSVKCILAAAPFVSGKTMKNSCK